MGYMGHIEPNSSLIKFEKVFKENLVGDAIYSDNVFRALLFSPAGIPMIILLVIGIQGFREEVGLKRSQLNIRNIFIRVYQLIVGTGLGMAMLIGYFVMGSYGVWQDIKFNDSKLNTPNIAIALVPLTISLALAISGFLTYLGGTQSVIVRLDDKNIHYGKS